MTCGHCQGAGRVFGRGRARRELARYRKKGPNRTTGLLVDGMAGDGIEGSTLLDIGGGIGAVGYALLHRGVERSEGVDASPQYVDVAVAEAKRLGYEDRISHRVADFLDVEHELGPADLVSLDRVICCYPDMRRLVQVAAEHAGTRMGLVYPVDRWWNRLLLLLPNAYFRVTRNPFRTFVHDSAAVRRAAEAGGLERVSRTRVGLWLVEVYSRPR